MELNRKIQEQAAVIAQRESQLETINVSLAQSRSDNESLESQLDNLNKIIRAAERTSFALVADSDADADTDTDHLDHGSLQSEPISLNND